MPVGGAPSEVLLFGPLEPDLLMKLPIPAAKPETTRPRLEFLAGDFSCYLSSFCRLLGSSRVFEPKLLLLVFLFDELPVVMTLLGRYFLI